jgi:predicted DNA-binding protein
MKTLVVRIPDEMEMELEGLASRHGRTKSAVVRQILSRGVHRRRTGDLSAFDLMRDQIGIVETGVGDLASNRKHMEGFGR